jgi:hypothetical protein
MVTVTSVCSTDMWGAQVCGSGIDFWKYLNTKFSAEIAVIRISTQCSFGAFFICRPTSMGQSPYAANDYKLVKEKSTRIVCNWQIRHLADKISRSVSSTNQLSSLHALLLHSFKKHFNIICLSSLGSMERYLLHVLKLETSTYCSSIRLDMVLPSHLTLTDNSNENFRENHKS